MPATAPTLTDCSMCGAPFQPERSWWQICRGCYRRPLPASDFHRLPGQLSLAETVEWAEATSPNVVALRPRRAA